MPQSGSEQWKGLQPAFLRAIREGIFVRGDSVTRGVMAAKVEEEVAEAAAAEEAEE